ncbi:MAG: PP2C family protein-serine/threonine phosphatase [Acidimicrobiales bacterium]
MRRRRSIAEAIRALREGIDALEDPDDDAAVAEALTSALGVAVEVSVHESVGLTRDERRVALRDPFRPGRSARFRFTSRYEVAADSELAELTHIVDERISSLRRIDEESAGRRRAMLRGALAEGLLGVTDVAVVADVLTAHVVPRIAADCRLLRAAVDGDEGADVALRVPAEGWPAFAYSALADDDPATRCTAWELGSLAARAAATCIEVEDELFARQVLERSLLPQALLPSPGLEVGSRYRPAGGSSALAGGDFYDVLRHDGNAVLIVGDVQGKGIEAAALTSVARHTLRAGALQGMAPAPLLALLNDVLLYGFEEQRSAGEMPAPRFLTAVVAHLRSEGHGFHVTFARAGHQPPVIVRRDGTVELFQPDGALLGALDDVHLEQAETRLDLGDTLVLYTDGVSEQRDTHDPFDEHALGHLVRSRSDVNDADAIAQLILDTVLLVTDTHQRDDIALVVARVV